MGLSTAVRMPILLRIILSVLPVVTGLTSACGDADDSAQYLDDAKCSRCSINLTAVATLSFADLPASPMYSARLAVNNERDRIVVGVQWELFVFDFAGRLLGEEQVQGSSQLSTA
jgi:hypothetical protein